MNLIERIKDVRRKITLADQAMACLESDLSLTLCGTTDPEILVIQQTVCDHYHLPLIMMTSDLKPFTIAKARRFAIALSLDLTQLSAVTVAGAFARCTDAVRKSAAETLSLCAQDKKEATEYHALKESARAKLNALAHPPLRIA